MTLRLTLNRVAIDRYKTTPIYAQYTLRIEMQKFAAQYLTKTTTIIMLTDGYSNKTAVCFVCSYIWRRSW